LWVAFTTSRCIDLTCTAYITWCRSGQGRNEQICCAEGLPPVICCSWLLWQSPPCAASRRLFLGCQGFRKSWSGPWLTPKPPAKSAGLSAGCCCNLQHFLSVLWCLFDALRGKSGNASVKPGGPICNCWGAMLPVVFWNGASRVVLICQRPCMRPTLRAQDSNLLGAWCLPTRSKQVYPS